MQIDLDPIAHNAEMRIDDIEMRIDTKGDGKHAVALAGVAIKEITIIKIPVGA